MNGSEMIAAERRRHMDAECWTPEHDDQHRDGQLVRAAACYAAESVGEHWVNWPWMPWEWKPSDDPIRNLVRAGALIAAEIDRIQRSTRCDGYAPENVETP